jgi:predicted CXXCH cytochrome family protein
MKRLQVVGRLLGATVALAVAVPDRPTFTRDVLPIMQRSCQTCHRPNMSTPMSLLTYDEVRPWARSIKQQVEARVMPPWFADRTVGVYRDDPSLSETEIATVAR